MHLTTRLFPAKKKDSTLILPLPPPQLNLLITTHTFSSTTTHFPPQSLSPPLLLSRSHYFPPYYFPPPLIPFPPLLQLPPPLQPCKLTKVVNEPTPWITHEASVRSSQTDIKSVTNQHNTGSLERTYSVITHEKSKLSLLWQKMALFNGFSCSLCSRFKYLPFKQLQAEIIIIPRAFRAIGATSCPLDRTVPRPTWKQVHFLAIELTNHSNYFISILKSDREPQLVGITEHSYLYNKIYLIGFWWPQFLLSFSALAFILTWLPAYFVY